MFGPRGLWWGMAYERQKNYRMGAPIGSGSRGEALLGTWRGSAIEHKSGAAAGNLVGEPGAVEVVFTVLDGADTAAPQRWEAIAAASERCPGIARVVGEVRERGKWYAARQYVEGVDLAVYMLAGQADAGVGKLEPIAAGIAIFDALEALHAQGVVHGDVCPANLIVTKAGAWATPLALIDYEGTPDGSATVAYASPQLVAGQKPCPADDVWAAAQCLRELQSHQRTAQAFAPEIDEALTRCLQIDPDLRPSAARVKQRLRALQNSRAEAAGGGISGGEISGGEISGGIRGGEIRGGAWAQSGAGEVWEAQLVAAAQVRADQDAQTAPPPGRRARRWFTAAVAAASIIVAGALAGPWRAPQASAETRRGVQELFNARDSALVAGNGQALRATTAPGPLRGADMRTLSKLRQTGVSIEGFSTTVSKAVQLGSAGRVSVIRAEVTQNSHRQIAPGGAATEIKPVQRCVNLYLLASGPKPGEMIALDIEPCSEGPADHE